MSASPGWHDVRQEMPDADIMVLGMTAHGSYYLAATNGVGWVDAEDGDPLPKIAFWMDLPAPPEVVEETMDNLMKEQR